MTTHPAPRRDEAQRLLLQGLSNKQIAFDIGMSFGCVKTHLRFIMMEHGATNRTMCALMIVGAIPDRKEQTRFRREQFIKERRTVNANRKLRRAGFTPSKQVAA